MVHWYVWWADWWMRSADAVLFLLFVRSPSLQRSLSATFTCTAMSLLAGSSTAPRCSIMAPQCITQGVKQIRVIPFYSSYTSHILLSFYPYSVILGISWMDQYSQHNRLFTIFISFLLLSLLKKKKKLWCFWNLHSWHQTGNEATAMLHSTRRNEKK